MNKKTKNIVVIVILVIMVVVIQNFVNKADTTSLEDQASGGQWEITSGGAIPT